MQRFPELKGLSTFIKITVALEVLIGIVFAIFIDTGWMRAAGLILSLLIAFTYWIQARFIDILLQINSNTMDTLGEVRSLLKANRMAAYAALPASGNTPAMSNPSRNVVGQGRGLNISLEPALGAPGSTFAVSISGGTVGSAIKIMWMSVVGEPRVLKTINADGQGYGRTVVVVPHDAQPGLTAVACESSGRRVSTQFTVIGGVAAGVGQPAAVDATHSPAPQELSRDDAWLAAARGRVGTRVAIEIEPTQVAAGGEVTIYVAGTPAKSIAVLTLADSGGTQQWRTSAWSNGDGAVIYRTSLPAGLSEGTYIVEASVNKDSASAPLTVTA